MTNDGKLYDTRRFTEDGVHEAIMLSNQPKAKEFHAWIRGVLKDIRKYGIYLNNEALEKLTHSPSAFAILVNAYVDEKEKNGTLEAESQLLKNKVEQITNTVGNTSELITMSEMAKILSSKHSPIGRDQLYEKLKYKGILMQNHEPDPKYIDAGYFVIREVIKGGSTYLQTMITGKGQKFIVNCLKQAIDESRMLSFGEEQLEAIEGI